MSTKSSHSCAGGRPIVVEHIVAKVSEPRTTEARAAGGKKLYEATVFVCDKPTANLRIYPRARMAANVERLRPLLAEGMLAGSVDHESYFDGGGLKTSCILWRSLEIDSTGAGIGKFEIVEDHSVGRDLKAIIKAGMAVGFSLMGYGTAREPSDDERRLYSLEPGTRCIIMNDDYTIEKIDCVDRPAVRTTKKRLEADGAVADNALDNWEETLEAEFRAAVAEIKNYGREARERRAARKAERAAARTRPADRRDAGDVLEEGLDDLKNYGKSNAPEEPEGGDDVLEALDDLKNYGKEARERRASRARERRESRRKPG